MFCMFPDVCYVFLVNVIAFPGRKSQFPGLSLGFARQLHGVQALFVCGPMG